ncbi:MAG: hypothetical protein C5B50_21895 [Verrucomicrobia bacterium]|nr:MAG: hypothetical protein C5B50_21895 [Verrucomicrobiota bacterium]
MKLEIEPGLVFAIRLLNGAYGFGQLLVRQEPIFYMAGYDAQSQTPTLGHDTIWKAKPVLLGNFFDVLIRNGRWAPVGHSTPPVVPYPCFKIRIGDKFYVETWDRNRKREATEDELAQLQPRSNYGPIFLENALNAYFGLRPWETAFEPLRTETVLAVSKLC